MSLTVFAAISGIGKTQFVASRIWIAGNIVILQVLAGAVMGLIKVSDWCTFVKISQAGEELIFIIAIYGI